MSDNTNRTHIDRPDEHHFNGDAPPNSYDLSEVKEVDQKIELSYGTKACCTECGREDAPYLFLKKSNGLYQLLCKDFDGSGCWPNTEPGLVTGGEASTYLRRSGVLSGCQGHHLR